MSIFYLSKSLAKLRNPERGTPFQTVELLNRSVNSSSMKEMSLGSADFSYI